MRNLSLDGLRGVAVLLVLIYHHDYLNMGWMGVDLFFVLSGYLITSILRNNRHDRFFWKEFWIRRTTRILPPLILLLCAAALLTFSISTWQALAYLASFGDILALLRTNFEPLRPLWSLAVEEHFYLIWPFAVRNLSRRSLGQILCALLLLEPLLRVLITLFRPGWQIVYFLTPFRLDGLALGCLLSLGLESFRFRYLATKWSGLGVAAAIVLFGVFRLIFGKDFTRGHPTPIYNGICYSLVSFAAFFIISYVLTHPSAIISRLLSWQPLVFVGIISYGLYLYQVLIRVTLTRIYGINDHKALWIDTPIILLISWLSFHFYERPIIAWGKRLTIRYHLEKVTHSH